MTPEETRERPVAEWTIELACGDRIALPFGESVPAMAARLVQHHSSCRDATRDEAPYLAQWPPLPILRGVAWR